MNEAVAQALDLRSTAEGYYRATNLSEGHGGVVVGGQMVAQALVAAGRTFPGKEALSIHAVFTRGASPTEPLELRVEAMGEGRSFASAAVTVSQEDRVCAMSAVLLHSPDPDLIRHSDGPPVVPPAEALADIERWYDGRVVRIVDAIDVNDPESVGPAELSLWTRFPGAPEDLVVSQALLAYVSCEYLIGTAMRPHHGVGQSMAHVSVSTTVLAHTVAFHEPFWAGDWLLLSQRSSYAGRGRSHGDAQVFSRDGRLVASVSQVNMIRGFPEGQAPLDGERAKH